MSYLYWSNWLINPQLTADIGHSVHVKGKAKSRHYHNVRAWWNGYFIWMIKRGRSGCVFIQYMNTRQLVLPDCSEHSWVLVLEKKANACHGHYLFKYQKWYWAMTRYGILLPVPTKTDNPETDPCNKSCEYMMSDCLDMNDVNMTLKNYK